MEDTDEVVVVGGNIGGLLYGTEVGKGAGTELDVPSLATMEVCKSDGMSWRQLSMNHQAVYERPTFFPNEEIAQPASAPAAPVAELTRVVCSRDRAPGMSLLFGSARTVSG